MPLTSEQGYKIREEYSDIKEKAVCDAHGLTQIGGSRTKIDGQSGDVRKSIKNASGTSTQVHLTTQKHFMETLGIRGLSSAFIRNFCGNAEYDYNGKDRRTIKEIDPAQVDAFKEFLDANKEKVVDLIIRNGDDVTHVVYNHMPTQEYELTYEEILSKIKDAQWVFLKGGVHLKFLGEMKKNGKGRKRGKTIFHFQREGKKAKSNRYNVLWHIHLNLFK